MQWERCYAPDDDAPALCDECDNAATTERKVHFAVAYYCQACAELHDASQAFVRGLRIASLLRKGNVR